MAVDIIVPIYNAYEYTIECVKTIINNTDLETNNLILINDKSPDERIAEYLEKLQKENIPNINILHNEENLGFVGTVNRGMSLSKNDVLLLNSDTEVTHNWLNKMHHVAYLNRGIGSVTSLTNNGTICSVPNFCEDNEIPKGLTVDQYAEIIEKTSLKMYPSIPTAVGFCMYIKREVLDKVGLFDVDTFGKGYGEENDFCCRALEHGYYHVLADDTFIYHKGSTSFLGNKEELCRKHLEILNNRYPYYDKMIQEFIQANPLKAIQDNVKLQIRLRNNNHNILFILHNDFINGINHPIGGTEFHVKDLIENLHNTNAFVAIVHDRSIIIQAFINCNITDMIEFKFKINDRITEIENNNYQYKKRMEEIVDYFAIDTIHVHHFRTHTKDIVDIATEKKIPLYITLHDYYAICPKVNLLDSKSNYCKTTRSSDECRKCIKQHLGYNEYIIEEWNNSFYESLQKATKIIAPSQSAKKIIEQYFDKDEISIEVIEHGVDNSDISNDNKINEKLKIAFIGGLSPIKGSKIAYRLIKEISDVEWHIFGNIGDAKLQHLEKNNLVMHGRYDRNEIAAKLIQEKIDLVCIFSIWPETYSYTLSEALMARVPLIVTDIGALGERVRKYKCGWTVKLGQEVEGTRDIINNIIDDKEVYLSTKETVKQLRLPTKQEMASIYNELYIKNNLRSISSTPIINKEILNIYTAYNMQIAISDNNEAMLLLSEENQALTRELEMMRNTMGWKCLDYVRRNMPEVNKLGKKISKSLIRFKI